MDIQKMIEELDQFEFKALCNSVRELTNDNYHTLALLEIAKFYELDNYIKLFKEIEEEHERVGYLPMELAQKRLELGKEMMASLVSKIGLEPVQKLYNCL